jgi:hypothetical protein
MKRHSPAERSHLQHQVLSRAFHLGDFRPGCLIFWLIVFTFASTAPIYADSSTPAEDPPKDEVTFGGQSLQVRILRLGPNGIEFEPIHAKGKLSIQYEKIEKIVTQNIFIIFYGAEDTMVRGRLFGVEEGRLLIGADRVSAQRIPIKEIIAGISLEDYNGSFWKRQRIKYRHWRASLALGYRLFQKEQNFIHVPVGFGYVYENFDGFGTNSYVSWYIALIKNK